MIRISILLPAFKISSHASHNDIVHSSPHRSNESRPSPAANKSTSTKLKSKIVGTAKGKIF